MNITFLVLLYEIFYWTSILFCDKKYMYEKIYILFFKKIKLMNITFIILLG